MDRLPINFVSVEFLDVWIQKLTGNSLEEESGKITSAMIDEIWPLADQFSD